MLRKPLANAAKQLFALKRYPLATSIGIQKQNLNFQVSHFYNDKIPDVFKTSMTDGYVNRHLGNTENQVKSMLETLGCKSMDELMSQTVPSTIRLKKGEAFNHGRNTVVGIDAQYVVLEHMKKIAENNQ